MKIGRNDLCNCGSGKKYKKCCLRNYSYFSSEQDYRKIYEYKIYECVGHEDFDAGMANIIIVRQQPNLRYSYGVYYVDTFCLGLKKTHYGFDVPYERVEWVKNSFPEELLFEKMDYEYARAIVLGGILYTKKLGFDPDLDWRTSRYIIEADREANQKYLNRLDFGYKGKPYYIEGPDDNSKKIIKTLQENVGDGNFHYMKGIKPEKLGLFP